MTQQFDFDNKEFNVLKQINNINGVITEVDRLKAAKQILLGIAILYICTLVSYILLPTRGNDLLEISKMVFPPLATLIIAFYFKDNKPV